MRQLADSVGLTAGLGEGFEGKQEAKGSKTEIYHKIIVASDERRGELSAVICKLNRCVGFCDSEVCEIEHFWRKSSRVR